MLVEIAQTELIGIQAEICITAPNPGKMVPSAPLLSEEHNGQVCQDNTGPVCAGKLFEVSYHIVVGIACP